jgi:HemY protein
MKAKILSFIVKLLLIAILWVYFLNNPGKISIDWQGWHLSTSLTVCVFGIISLLAVLSIMRNIKRTLWDLLKISDSARYKAIKEGFEYLEKALIETYLQNQKKAEEHIKKAQGLLKKTSFPKLLSHYLAKKTGVPEIQALKKYGPLKALFTLQRYQQERDWEGVEKFFQKPSNALLKEGWFWRECFLYQKDMKNWKEAKKALDNCEKYESLTKEEVRIESAYLFYQTALEEKDPLKKRALFEKAFAADPKNVENAIAYAQDLCAIEDTRGAKKVLTALWKVEPQWMIAQTYARLFAKDKSPLAQCHCMRELYDLMPNNTLSQIAFAVSLIQSKLWGQAEVVIQSIQDPSAQALLVVILNTKEKNKDDTIPFKDFKKFVQTLDALKVDINTLE